jgi:hypothetical protein
MPFNRIDGFYTGGFNSLEPRAMSIDDTNKELNAILDNRLAQLNSAIDAHEKALKAMMVPRDVWHIYHAEDDLDPSGEVRGEYQYLIGMIKWQGSWRLCHFADYEPGPGEWDWKPLVDSSIPDRLRAVPHLNELQAKIIEAKNKLIPELEAAIAALAKSLPNSEKSMPRKK